MSIRPELHSTISHYDQSFEGLRRVAEARFGLFPDESYEAASAALKRWMGQGNSQCPGAELALYGEVLDDCAQRVLERRKREQEFFENPLTTALYQTHHSRLAGILESRFGLDFDRADSASQQAIKKFVRTAQLKSEAGDRCMLEMPERYLPYLYSTCVAQAAADERAKFEGLRHRDAFRPSEGLPTDVSEPPDEAEPTRPARLSRFEPLSINLKANTPDIEEVIDRQRTIQQAAPLLTRVPAFFDELESRTGLLAARFSELRRLARMMGAEDPVEEFCFVQRYLFENKSHVGERTRRDLTRQLGWCATKSGNAKSLALRRLRVRLQAAWNSALSGFFAPSIRGLCSAETK